MNKKIQVDLSGYSKEDLIELNRQIKSQFDYLERLEQHQALIKYKAGDRVAFTTFEGRTVKGIIVKVNKKTISIEEDRNRMAWKVTPSLLRRLNHNGKSDSDSAKIVNFRQ